MAWQIEVKVRITQFVDHGPQWEWRAVRPTGGQPYRFETRTEAESMRRMCYPDQTADEVRVTEVK